MSDTGGSQRSHETVTVRYWAGARAAAGTPEDSYDVDAPVALSDLLARVLERHPGDRMARTVGVCSVLVGDQPVRSRDPETVLVAPGEVVELLPPFAGG